MARSDPLEPGYRTQSEDASREIEELQFQRWRSMSVQEKAALLSELCRSEHALSLAGLRYHYQDATPRELELRAACLRLGRENVERALGAPLPFEE